MANDNDKTVQLDAERINIIDRDGNLRMTLSNSELTPDIVTNGKKFKRSGLLASGLIFYNNEGDECGGLLYGSMRHPQGVEQFGSFTFDAVNGDQVVKTYFHENYLGDKMYGNILIDQPGHVKRAYTERYQDGSVAMGLCDSKGRDRIRMSIDADDVPRLEFLDENGEVIYKLPPM